VLQFKSAVESDPESFPELYSQLVDKYLHTPEYAETIAKFHAVWWRIPIGTAAKLAGQVVAEDQSYEEIYTRDYIYTNLGMASVYDQLHARVLSDYPTSPGDYRKIFLSADEPRFRGLFGSPEFLRVYPDTLSNFNRKRSSQVFRIAFCETLANNVPSGQILPLQDPSLPDEHGSNPECVGCHRRLDPVARFFDKWRPPATDGQFAEYDPSRPDNGAVYLGGASGIDRVYNGTGDRDLGRLVVDQPEFHSCVGQLAWRLVFGTDIPLDQATKSELAAAYRGSKRFNSPLKLALLNPYFWSAEEPPPITYEAVKPILAGCGSCHTGSRRTQFDPSIYPFRSDEDGNAGLVKRIWGAVNHLANYRPMPQLPGPGPGLPAPKLAPEDIDLLRNWILRGAVADDGRTSLNDRQIEEILQ
jgi:hypothetical protein